MIKLIDLSKITRDAGKIFTEVRLCDGANLFLWIKFSQCYLRKFNDERWCLGAYLRSATDFEHDSAHALSLSLIGINFESIDYGLTRFSGWIKPDSSEHFRVPTPGYNPLKHPETEKCSEDHCQSKENRHVIVPENFYVPPENTELFKLVRGRRVEVVTGFVNKNK